MKKTLAFLLIILTVQLAKAQNEADDTFKKFKVDVSLGYAIPQGSGTKGGIIFVIEPKYAVLQQFSVGLRMEAAALVDNLDYNGNSGTVTVLGSYLATGDYYFTNSKFRPFAGIGAGVYRSASGTFVDGNNTSTTQTASQFGFMARGGFELGHLRVGIEYNFLKENAGYLGLKLGVCFGGGRK